MHCNWCCARCRPRYKRHVDNIFPYDPKQGLVKGEMQKLTYYALTNQRKLDRIGNYLADYLKYYVDDRRFDYAAIAMKAMEQLLQACRQSSINLFVESFLRMVEKLLECPEANLQVMGSNSFVQFASIQEDTPSYHRRYDFFVTKFSNMCWSSVSNDTTNRALRQAGLRGLQGVIHKTVSDDLQVNIWEDIHIQKIIRALIFNIHEGFTNSIKSPSRIRSMSPWDSENSDTTGDIDPDHLAQSVLQDLVSRATYGHIKSLMIPLLCYMDNKQLWVPNKFPIYCMSLIMHSIQMQSASLVISQLLAHLENYKDHTPKIRCAIIEVVTASFSAAAVDSLGPTMLEVFDSYLKYLKISIETCSKEGLSKETIDDEEAFQAALVQSVGQFSVSLQTYQRIETCTFILGRIPARVTTVQESQYESVLLQCLTLISQTLNICADDNNIGIGLPTLFPLALIGPLHRLALSDSAKTRAIIQQIFHRILDRRNNQDKIVPSITLGDLPEENIFVGPQKQQDVLFLKRNGPEIYYHLYDGLLQEDNSLDNYTLTYRTAVLWLLEVPTDEVLVELLHMVFGLQDEACSHQGVSVSIIHSLVASFLMFACRYTRNDAMLQHVDTIIRKRQNEAPYLLPTVAFSYLDKDSEPLKEGETQEDMARFMFDATVISECLNQQGMSTDRLAEPYQFKKSCEISIDGMQLPRTPESVRSLRLSMIDPKISDVQVNVQEEITFDSLKQALQLRKQTSIMSSSKDRLLSGETFEECVARSAQKTSHMKALRQQIFGSFRSGDISPTESLHSLIDVENLNNLSIELPDMYVY